MKHQPLFEVISEIVERICEYGDDLRIFTDETPAGFILTVLPNMADYPKLVGKHGRQVNAFAFLVRLAGARLGCKVGFSLKESFVGRREPTLAFAYNPDFDRIRFQRLLQSLAEMVLTGPLSVSLSEDHEVLKVTIGVARGDEAETIVNALDSVFYAYCYRNGRRLQLKPEYLNH
jgi:predicted RNA-binding protein YlqC (UPF0109 family)